MRTLSATKKYVLGHDGRMELKRRLSKHPNRKTLCLSKPISYWRNEECIRSAELLNIDFSDLVTIVDVERKKKLKKVDVNILAKLQCNTQPCEQQRQNAKKEKAPSCGMPMSYQIKVITGSNQNLLIQLVNTTKVLELKHYLCHHFGQSSTEKQSLVFAHKEMKNDDSLYQYFLTKMRVDVYLSQTLEIRYGADNLVEKIENTILIADTASPFDLLEKMCRIESWDITSKELQFQDSCIEGSLQNLASLGIKNQSMMLVQDNMSISYLNIWHTMPDSSLIMTHDPSWDLNNLTAPCDG